MGTERESISLIDSSSCHKALYDTFNLWQVMVAADRPEQAEVLWKRIWGHIADMSHEPCEHTSYR